MEQTHRSLTESDVLSAEEAANLAGVSNIPQKGTRLGNWLTRASQELLSARTTFSSCECSLR
jgi:hypothetical protein